MNPLYFIFIILGFGLGVFVTHLNSDNRNQDICVEENLLNEQADTDIFESETESKTYIIFNF